MVDENKNKENFNNLENSFSTFGGKKFGKFEKSKNSNNFYLFKPYCILGTLCITLTSLHQISNFSYRQS
jgi:hypothetical protein